ncbi:hypothetical protein EDC01DRAFT_776997 [Geopyxis carbonaria]|nr:hypothetical protein EDC01DRAFT_776997 [Geopyxis carbonaria]
MSQCGAASRPVVTFLARIARQACLNWYIETQIAILHGQKTGPQALIDGLAALLRHQRNRTGREVLRIIEVWQLAHRCSLTAVATDKLLEVRQEVCEGREKALHKLSRAQRRAEWLFDRRNVLRPLDVNRADWGR